MRAPSGDSDKERIRLTLRESWAYGLSGDLGIGPRAIGVGVYKDRPVVVATYLRGGLWTKDHHRVLQNFSPDAKARIAVLLSEIHGVLDAALINANDLIFVVNNKGIVKIANPYAWTPGDLKNRSQTYQANARSFEYFYAQLTKPVLASWPPKRK